MDTNNGRALTAFLGLVLFATLGACNCNRSASSTAEQDGDSKAASANAPRGQGDAEAAPPGDLYPGMNFGKLSSGERRTFVSVAKSELCPCPESKTSLHECLQSGESACALAKRSATVVARGVEAGLSEKDILSKLARFLKEVRKHYEFELESAPRRGPEDAPVRIVEFADFQCPHCKRASSMLADVVEKYDGEIAHYFKHFPISGHGEARLAARAAVAAQMQGKFWPMHDLLFENQRSLSRKKIHGFARRLGMNFSKFKKDMGGTTAADRVQKDRKEGLEANISGTPAVFINGRRYMGPLRKKALIDAIDVALESAGTSEASEAGADAG